MKLKVGTVAALVLVEFNQENTMTLIIFISALLLTFGAIQLKEAIEA